MSLRSSFLVVPVVATQVFIQLSEVVGTLHALQSGEISTQVADVLNSSGVLDGFASTMTFLMQLVAA
ncbi:MAG: hypothetical protein ABJM43_07550 [Paracoccaceae bacterium]|uniref:hypothetical protein n=1 Tax=Paracoccaceae TaxID=31989 RepID=UPI0032982FFC